MAANRIQLGANLGLTDYEQAGNKRHQIMRTLDDGTVVPLDAIRTSEEMQWCMELTDEHGRNLYDTDPSYRATVMDLSEASQDTLLAEDTGAYRNPIPTDEEMLEGLRQDAFQQYVERLADQAGGNDLIAKYNAAHAMVYPTEEQYALLSEAQQRTQPEGLRPFENMLKQRRAEGLGPLRVTVTPDDAQDQAYEDAKNAEALAYLEEHGGGTRDEGEQE